MVLVRSLMTTGKHNDAVRHLYPTKRPWYNYTAGYIFYITVFLIFWDDDYRGLITGTIPNLLSNDRK